MAINYKELLFEGYTEAQAYEYLLDQLVADGLVSESDINRAARTIVEEEFEACEQLSAREL